MALLEEAQKAKKEKEKETKREYLRRIYGERDEIEVKYLKKGENAYTHYEENVNYFEELGFIIIPMYNSIGLISYWRIAIP